MKIFEVNEDVEIEKTDVEAGETTDVEAGETTDVEAERKNIVEDDPKNITICVMCEKKITRQQIEGGRRTYWNEGISNGKLIKAGWIHQECLGFNSGVYEKSYFP